MDLKESDRRRILEWVAGHPEISGVYLFGSRARGDNRPNSDIDLAITMHTGPGHANARATWVGWYRGFLKNPDLVLSEKADLMFHDPAETLREIGAEVASQGIRIYP